MSDRLLVMKRDTSTWLTKKQAAEALGVSEKTIERLTQQHQLAPVERKREEDNRRELAYDPEEVERLKNKREKPVNAVLVPEKAIPPALPNGKHSELAGFIAALSGGASAPVRLTDKLMLTEKEAALLAGVPRSLIAAWRKDGKLYGLQTGAGWRYRRSDLTRLIDSLD